LHRDIIVRSASLFASTNSEIARGLAHLNARLASLEAQTAVTAATASTPSQSIDEASSSSDPATTAQAASLVGLRARHVAAKQAAAATATGIQLTAEELNILRNAEAIANRMIPNPAGGPPTSVGPSSPPPSADNVATANVNGPQREAVSSQQQQQQRPATAAAPGGLMPVLRQLAMPVALWLLFSAMRSGGK
jgi:hypothetical protein